MKLDRPLVENDEKTWMCSPSFTLLVVLKFAFDHPNHDFVADQTALVHNLLRFPPKSCLLGDL